MDENCFKWVSVADKLPDPNSNLKILWYGTFRRTVKGVSKEYGQYEVEKDFRRLRFKIAFWCYLPKIPD